MGARIQSWLVEKMIKNWFKGETLKTWTCFAGSVAGDRRRGNGAVVTSEKAGPFLLFLLPIGQHVIQFFLLVGIQQRPKLGVEGIPQGLELLIAFLAQGLGLGKLLLQKGRH